MQSIAVRFLGRSAPALLVGLSLALPACKSADSATHPPAPSVAAHPGQGQISNEVTALAEVVAVDSIARVVTLKREDGTQFRVQCGDAVRNFTQIAVGDTLRVKYKETLAATRLAPDQAAAKGGVVLAAGRAKQGAKPAGGVGRAISVCVRIVSIDRERQIVVFSLPSGELIARPIATSEGREFVKSLQVGDLVQLDYTEVLALSIEKL